VKKSEEEEEEDQMKNRGKIAKENFIRGLLLALENGCVYFHFDRNYNSINI
jgi:hypothetical protein